MRYLGAPFARTAFARQYADLARMEDLVQGSDLDWTIMRPPSLINRRLRGSYRVAIGRNVRGGAFISRSDVAHGMLDAVDRPATIRQTIGIAY